MIRWRLSTDSEPPATSSPATTIAADITETGADYVLAVKDNQPSLKAKMESFLDTAQPEALDTVADVDKDHGRYPDPHGQRQSPSGMDRRKRAGFDPAYLDSLLNPASGNTH